MADEPKKPDWKRKPWMIRDVPEHTRRQVKMYAVEHDMTVARALEVIVEDVHRKDDLQLLDALLNMYRRVKAGDLEGAQTEAGKVKRHLSSRRRQWEAISDAFVEDDEPAEPDAEE